MRSMRFRLFLALVTFTSSVAAQGSPGVTTQALTGPIYLTHVTLIDTVAGRELPDRTVVISGDLISEVTASNRSKVPSDAQVLEGKGKYLIPGLWDMHVHALFPERIGSMFPMFVANGVLGIRDMGTSMPLADIERLRQEIASGSRLGPRFVAAGPLLDGRPKPLRPNFLAITTPEQGRATVDSLKGDGADFIKVYSWLSRDTFLAIAGEANKLKIPFAGHVPFSVPVLEASDAGMKSMEHLHGVVLSCSAREDELRSEMLKGGTNLPGDDRLRLEMHEAAASYDAHKAAPIFAHLAKNKTWQVPTLVVWVPYVQSFDTRITTDPRLKYIPPSAQQRWTRRSKVLDRRCDQSQNLRKAISNCWCHAAGWCPDPGRDRRGLVSTLHLRWILVARRTRFVGSCRADASASTAERYNRSRAIPGQR